MFRWIHIRYAALFAMLVFVTFADVHAQRKDFKYKFIAMVMNADTAAAIPNCHILNKTQMMGTVSDDYGAFTITANLGDSIMFSTIGFAKRTIVVRDSMYTNNRIVKLTPAIYMLSEVDIGLLSTYDRFKRDVMSKETGPLGYQIDPISRFSVPLQPLPNQGGINIPGLGSPVSFLYSLWSTEGKQQRHFLSIMNGTADFIVIGEKFNGLIVHQLTGLKDDELVKFMSYCMFTKEFLLLSSEAEINRHIMRKYREYMKIKN